MTEGAAPGPANDNMPGTITPDDAPFLLTLGAVCVGIVALALYVLLAGAPDDVTAMLQR